jgi:hypothetical protein
MANRKISDLTALTTTATGDLLPIIDISEAGAVDQNKKITVENLFKGIPGNVGIGTTGPTALLELSGSGIVFKANTTTTTSTSTSIQIGGLTTSSNSGCFLKSYTNLGSTLASSLAFEVNGGATEAARIDSSGNVQIGTTVGGARLTIEKNFAGGTAIDINTTTASTAYNAAVFRHNSTVVGYITVSTGSTSYNTSSDYRLKENVTPVTDGITRLQQLNPSRFNFIADPDRTVDGFIAHEVQDIVPEAITGEKDAEDDDGNPIYQGIDQAKLVPLLTAALQEAIAKIETLEARLTAAGIA